MAKTRTDRDGDAAADGGQRQMQVASCKRRASCCCCSSDFFLGLTWLTAFLSTDDALGHKSPLVCVASELPPLSTFPASQPTNLTKPHGNRIMVSRVCHLVYLNSNLWCRKQDLLRSSAGKCKLRGGIPWRTWLVKRSVELVLLSLFLLHSPSLFRSCHGINDIIASRRAPKSLPQRV